MILRFVSLLCALTMTTICSAATCGDPWKCVKTAEAPTLDANLDDWQNVDPYKTSLETQFTTKYEDGEEVSYYCVYDDAKIYFALEIPGPYRFNSTDNKQCAAISTMMKIGESATFTNMGGCPDALGGCADGVPGTCGAYAVDVGAHWELKGTEQNVMYDVNTTAGSGGNDLIANKDDEFAVSAFCRLDDNDADAANEWAGAWAHTTNDAMGSYIFEMSRLLKTASVVSDGQFEAGETYEFGVAYWDPLETEGGWTVPGHYLTGCGKEWISLELVNDETPEDPATEDTSGSPATLILMFWPMLIGALLL